MADMERVRDDLQHVTINIDGQIHYLGSLPMSELAAKIIAIRKHQQVAKGTPND